MEKGFEFEGLCMVCDCICVLKIDVKMKFLWFLKVFYMEKEILLIYIKILIWFKCLDGVMGI